MNKLINQSELVKIVSEKTGQDIATVENFVNALFKQIGNKLKEDSSVHIDGIGTFTLNEDSTSGKEIVLSYSESNLAPKLNFADSDIDTLNNKNIVKEEQAAHTEQTNLFDAEDKIETLNEKVAIPEMKQSLESSDKKTTVASILTPIKVDAAKAEQTVKREISATSTVRNDKQTSISALKTIPIVKTNVNEERRSTATADDRKPVVRDITSKTSSTNISTLKSQVMPLTSYSGNIASSEKPKIYGSGTNDLGSSEIQSTAEAVDADAFTDSTSSVEDNLVAKAEATIPTTLRDNRISTSQTISKPASRVTLSTIAAVRKEDTGKSTAVSTPKEDSSTIYSQLESNKTISKPSYSAITNGYSYDRQEDDYEKKVVNKRRLTEILTYLFFAIAFLAIGFYVVNKTFMSGGDSAKYEQADAFFITQNNTDKSRFVDIVTPSKDVSTEYISRVYYGNEKYSSYINKANEDVLEGTNIIRKGQLIKIPILSSLDAINVAPKDTTSAALEEALVPQESTTKAE